MGDLSTEKETETGNPTSNPFHDESAARPESGL